MAALRAGASDQPVVILDHPQLGENIGFAARAMLNCGLVHLRIAKPRGGWPNERATAAAAGATSLLDAARISDDLGAATADLTRLYATTARPRDMRKPVLTPRAAAAEMTAVIASGGRVGILFGRERTGLENDDISRADAIIEAPLNPEFPSLNLAQAVLLVAYEWRLATMGEGAEATRMGGSGGTPATQAETAGLFAHLEDELDSVGFFWPEEKAPRMRRNLRTMFLRAGLTDQDVRTLRGVVKALAKGRKGRGSLKKSRSSGKGSRAKGRSGPGN
ncbi:MAG: RNA methyltransferase [Alphaproteobacteria bacterium]